MNKRSERLPIPVVAVIWLCAVAGLVVGLLLFPPLSRLPGGAGWVVPLAVSGSLGLLGALIGTWRHRQLSAVLPPIARAEGGGGAPANSPILMDTSAIIDGRIADLAATGFLMGTLHVPNFVLDELRHIADSSEPLRRNRGRRGLEVLTRLNQDPRAAVNVLDVPYQNGADVDARLISLAKQMNARLLTTDFNLNRSAEVRGVKVLNINELANAIRQVVLPGEDMSLRVIQEGREAGQGIGFLDDGTMVVVEGGKRFLNSDLDVTVSRVLQTPTGRIIFAQPKAAA